MCFLVTTTTTTTSTSTILHHRIIININTINDAGTMTNKNINAINDKATTPNINNNQQLYQKERNYATTVQSMNEEKEEHAPH